MHTQIRGTRRWVPSLTQRNVGPIGLDLGRSAARLIQFRKGSDQRLHLAATASVEIQGHDNLYDTLGPKLKFALREGGFRGRRLVVAMPANDYRLISISYRRSAEQTHEQAIAEQMQDRLDGPMSDYVMDAIPVRSAARDAEQQALVAVCERQRALSLLACLDSAGLQADVIEVAPVALRRLVSKTHDGDQNLTLIINTGRDRSYLTLLHGRRLLLDQSIDFGETRLLQRLAESLDISIDQARGLIIRTGLHGLDPSSIEDHREGETGVFNTLLEILRPALNELVEHTDQAFMYAAAQTRGGGSASVLLFGALSRWPGCADVLSNMTRLTVTVPDADRLIDGEHGDLHMPDYAVAAGLALRGLWHDT
ncbi:MAG: pilus assembly protein PilM [Pseudomonadota bacterium]